MCIAAVARPLGHENLPGSPAPKDLGRRANDQGMRVDLRRRRAGLDQVGLQEHGLASGPRRAQPQLSQALGDCDLEVNPIVGRLGDEDVGSMTPFVPVSGQAATHSRGNGGTQAGQQTSALHDGILSGRADAIPFKRSRSLGMLSILGSSNSRPGSAAARSSRPRPAA